MILQSYLKLIPLLTGPEKMGVVLSRHADVQLKVAELIVDSCWIVMFKVSLLSSLSFMKFSSRVI